MPKHKLAWLWLLFIVFMAPTQANQTITLRLLATSDVHGHFSGYDYFQQQNQALGLAHLTPIIKEQRATADVSLLIDNGDLIQGSALTEMLQAKYHKLNQGDQLPSVATLLKFIGYDAANLGNHEFDYGLEYLHHAYNSNDALGAQVPLLSANLKAYSKHAKSLLRHQEFHLISKTLQVNGKSRELTIGLVGVLPPQIMQWNAHHIADHVKVSSMVEGAARAVQKAKHAGADIIVLVAHAGMPKHTSKGIDSEQGVWQLAQLANVDAIIFGHQHEVFPGSNVYDRLEHVDSQRGTIFDKPAVQPGTQGSHLGVIDLALRFTPGGWQTVNFKSRVVAAAQQPDPKILTHLSSSHDATLAYMKQPIGQSAHDLSHAFSRTKPTYALQFIHAAQLWYAKRHLANGELPWNPEQPLLSAVAPFHAATTEEMYNSGSFTLIPSGILSLGDIGDLYRYPNTLAIVRVNGTMLKQWLEQSAAALQPSHDQPWGLINQAVPSYQFDTFAGIQYQINVNSPVGQRVYSSSSFSEDAEYYVVTNNYRANGGGDFAGLDGSQIVYRSPDQIQHILVSYLAFLGEQGYQNELIENWLIIED